MVVYCGLTGGETHGMLAGAAAGWVQDVHFGGPVVGLSGLTKVLVGFGGRRWRPRASCSAGPAPRVLVLFAAALADALLFEAPGRRLRRRGARRSRLLAAARARALNAAGGRGRSSSCWTGGCAAGARREDLRGPARRAAPPGAWSSTWWSRLLALLAGYFWHLQVLRGTHYRELAENNRIRVVPIAAPRGPLLDRNGRVLVENRSSFNVVLTTEHSAGPGRQRGASWRSVARDGRGRDPRAAGTPRRPLPRPWW